jgi:hypothetical protein
MKDPQVEALESAGVWKHYCDKNRRFTEFVTEEKAEEIRTWIKLAVRREVIKGLWVIGEHQTVTSTLFMIARQFIVWHNTPVRVAPLTSIRKLVEKATLSDFVEDLEVLVIPGFHNDAEAAYPQDVTEEIAWQLNRHQHNGLKLVLGAKRPIAKATRWAEYASQFEACCTEVTL